VLRPGAVDVETLREVMPDVQVRATAVATDANAMRSPGLLPQHYSPRTPMVLYPHGGTSRADALVNGVHETLAAGQRVGVLATREDARLFRDVSVVIAELGSETDVEAIAARLYSALRELDAAKLDVIVVRDFQGETGLWRTVRDRLRRASLRYAGSTDESRG
jgi:L-threonylcarbamoyladenylate synthase